MAAHICNPTIWNVKTGESWQLGGQPGLQNETLSQHKQIVNSTDCFIDDPPCVPATPVIDLLGNRLALYPLMETSHFLWVLHAEDELVGVQPRSGFSLAKGKCATRTAVGH